MRRITLDRFDQIRDQVVAPFQLNIDLGPGVVHPVPQFDQAVVDANDRQHQDDDHHTGNHITHISPSVRLVPSL